MQYFSVCSASCISMQLLWTRMRCEWAWEWKARWPCAKRLQMLDFPRVTESKCSCCNSPPAVSFYGFCSLLQDPPSPFDRQQRSSAIIVYRINHLVIKWLLHSFIPKEASLLAWEWITLFVDGQHLLFHICFSPEGCLTSPPPTQTSQALLAAGGTEQEALGSKTGGNRGDDEGRYSVWATLVHYHLRGGGRDIHMTA